MSEIPGASSSIPTLPEYPGQIFIAKLPPDEWQACLNLWIYSVEYRLRVSADAFRALETSDASSGLPFLLSYLCSSSENASDDNQSSASEVKLRKSCHLLLRRLCLESSLLHDLDPFRLYEVLSAGSTVFRRAPKWPETLGLMSKKAPKEVIAAYGAGLHTIEQDLSSNDPAFPKTFSTMRKAGDLLVAAPQAGVLFMTGTDYLETLIRCYDDSVVTPPAEKVAMFVTEHAYICLRSLMRDTPSKMSMLLDHLYSLKASADTITKINLQQPTLLSNLVCLTTLLRNLDISLGNTPNARGQKMLASLQEYRQMTLHLHPQTPRQRIISRKGKGKQGPNNDMHIHKASQISQIHELFPDLPTPYVLGLLDYYSDNVEQVIGTLLEPDSLPSGLQGPTKEDETEPELDHGLAGLAPRPTPPLLPQKKSVFDNDDFDNLQISPAKLHRGRKDKLLEMFTTGDEHSRSKAAIMTALAAFDADDDERDDTYDVADVGGTVDDTLDIDETRLRSEGDPNEKLLYSAWKASKEHFARDTNTRLSQPRRQLKADTGLSDEQIEGWGLMLSRNTKRENRLEQKYLSVAAFGGNQTTIRRTKWTAGSRSGTATENEESDVDPNATGGPNRGAGGFARGKGGSTAGPAHVASTQAARKQKEQGRGRGGASHNRREGRAKKVGHGMASPAAG
jgi:activating signal cointegrator complex subunit 2